MLGIVATTPAFVTIPKEAPILSFMVGSPVVEYSPELMFTPKPAPRKGRTGPSQKVYTARICGAMTVPFSVFVVVIVLVSVLV